MLVDDSVRSIQLAILYKKSFSTRETWRNTIHKVVLQTMVESSRFRLDCTVNYWLKVFKTHSTGSKSNSLNLSSTGTWLAHFSNFNELIHVLSGRSWTSPRVVLFSVFKCKLVGTCRFIARNTNTNSSTYILNRQVDIIRVVERRCSTNRTPSWSLYCLC